MNANQIAYIIYNSNGAVCHLNEEDWKPWEELTDDQRKGYEKAVLMKLANPEMTAEQQHEAWMQQRLEQGWVYGEVKDVENKVSPCLVPYDQLPKEQKMKDALFHAIVVTMANYVE